MRRSKLAAIVSLVLAVSCFSGRSAAQCPQWDDPFALEGLSGWVASSAVFDDGTGPALYVGGAFTTAGKISANRVAKWDGTTWSNLGSGLSGPVFDLAVFDDGSGSALYAGGMFTVAGGVAANRIARWDGSSWSAVGSGFDATVYSLSAFDDGSGQALYAGGFFETAGAVVVNHVAKWDGSSWTPLGSGMSFLGSVFALTAFDDGSGPALYAGGKFEKAGGVVVNGVAKWNGSSWSALGLGMNHTVNALTAFDDGTGTALYAAGQFTTAGGVGANRIARWDGAVWSALGIGLDGGPTGVCLAVFDDGSGPALHVGGAFASAGGVGVNSIARWDGSSWSALGAGANGTVESMTVFDDGSGSRLYAAGIFTVVGGSPANRIASWSGAAWSTLGPSGGLDEEVGALAQFDDGTGLALYAAGRFSIAGDAIAANIARWDGSDWSALGGSMSFGAILHALTVYDSGDGPELVASGHFTSAGGTPAAHVARWNGTTWSALGGGVNDIERLVALAVHDDGSGPALYAMGTFTVIDGVPANNVAKWDGTSWSALGAGLTGVESFTSALCVYDDGSGPALYAGGTFTSAGGAPARHIAKWDGATWSALGSGMNAGGHVHGLAVFDDGSGSALYASGFFTTAGGVPASHIARLERLELVVGRRRDERARTADDGLRRRLGARVVRRGELHDGRRSPGEADREVERDGLVGAGRRNRP